MTRNYSISVVLCLPMVMLLWQGSSCRSSNSNLNGTRTSMNDNRANTQEPGLRGTWGGQHISMEVNDAGAEIEYDCARGRITEKLVLDRSGNFQAKGIHVAEHPGPVRRGENNERPAAYSGSVHGETMTLTVKLTNNNEVIGTFTLTRGSAGRVRKCK